MLPFLGRRLGRLGYCGRLLLAVIIFLLLATFVLGLLRIIAAGSAPGLDDGHYRLVSAEQYLRLLPDGRIDHEERMKVDFTGEFEGMWRDIPLRWGDQIDQVAVADDLDSYQSGGNVVLGSHDRPGHFGTTKTSDCAALVCQRIVWHYQASDEIKRFVVRYRSQGLVTRYPQGVLADINIWGQNWSTGSGRLRTSLRLPQPLPPGTRIALAPGWLGAKISRSSRLITISATQIPRRQGLQLRLWLPGNYLPAARQLRTGSRRPAEAKLTEIDQADQPLDRWTSTSLGPALPLALALLLALLVYAGLLWLWSRLRPDAPSLIAGPIYEPPSDESLLIGWAHAEEAQTPSPQAYAATLVDLIARGYYQRETRRDEHGQWVLEISRPDSRPPAELGDHERVALAFTDNLLGRQSGPVRLDGLSSLARSSDTGSWQQLKEAQQREIDSTSSDRSGSFLAPGLVGLVVVALAVGLASRALSWPSYTYLSDGGPWTLAGSVVAVGLGLVAVALAGWVIAGWPRAPFTRVGPEAADAVARWRAYRQFVTAFDRMENVPALQAILFERAFAAALLWGVAEQFAAAVELHLGTEADALRGLDSLASHQLSALDAIIERQTAPPPDWGTTTGSSWSSGGGGGGFSGGGGGGGGGGGAW